MHGIVFKARQTWGFHGQIALKLHTREPPYLREKDTYERLADLKLTSIGGCDVPRAVHFDDQFLAMELTIVEPPFLLDFGGAWLDEAPEFASNIMDEWVELKKEQFEPNWRIVESILRELRIHGIHLLDIHPANIDLRGHPAAAD